MTTAYRYRCFSSPFEKGLLEIKIPIGLSNEEISDVIGLFEIIEKQLRRQQRDQVLAKRQEDNSERQDD